MQIATLTDPSCFQDLAQEWHDLLSHAVTNHIFITPEFQKSWWESLGEGTLHVITFRLDNGQLIGLAPFFRFSNQEKLQQVSIIGCVNVSDYLDILIHRDHVEEVYSALAYELGKIAWNVTFLCSIPEASPTLSTFISQFEATQFHITKTQQDVCPIIELPKSWDEYLSQIGKKQRHEIRRKWEKLEREVPTEFEVIDSPESLTEAITDFIALHQASSTEKKNFWDDDHVKFFQKFAIETANKGWLRLYFLKIKGRRVASMLGFEYDQKFFLYNSGFDAEEYRHLSVGNVLTAYTIKQAIERGNTQYDFLRGDEEYKFRFRASAHPIFDLKIVRK